MSGILGKGIRIDYIIPGSPAERAGAKVGDLIVQVDGIPVDTLQDFIDIKGNLKLYTVAVLRNGVYIAMHYDCTEPAVPVEQQSNPVAVLQFMGKIPTSSPNN